MTRLADENSMPISTVPHASPRLWLRYYYLLYTRLSGLSTPHLKMVIFCKGNDPTTRQPRTSNDFDHEDNAASREPPSPQVDGGKDAWCFLAAVFLFEAVIWGL